MKCYFRLSFLFLFSFFIGVCAFAQEPSTPWTQSLTVEDQDTLQVYIDPGNLQLIPTDKKEVKAKATGIPNEDLSRVKFETKGKIVKLDYRGDKSVPAAAFEIQVPSSFHLDLYVSGDVSSSAPVGGNVKIVTDSGDIDLTDVNGSINASTDSGEIYMKNTRGNAVLTAKDGDIDVEVVNGDLDLNNEDGDSYAKQVIGNLTATSTDGDITIGETDGNATVTSGIGDVMISKASGLTTINTTEGDIDLSEADNSIVIGSSGGDVTLKKISGPFEVKTDKGAVEAEIIPGRSGKGRITSREGDLEVSVPESAGVTILANVTDAGGSGETDDQDVIDSDFKATRKDKSGSEVRNEYVLNGGGDTILMETSTGSIQIRKLISQE